MHILAVDNDQCSLDALRSCLCKLFPGDTVAAFTDPMLAGKYAFNHSIRAVFTETEMKPVDGFALIKVIRKQCPGISVHFVTGHPDFERDAMRLMADSFIIKPVTLDKLGAAKGGRIDE